MKVTLAKTAGFCFGVDRAVSLVEEAVAAGKRVSTLGPIIHNRHVMDHFAAEGVRELSEPEEAAAGTTVVIRSHGVSRDVYERLSRRGVEIVDATCPFVKRIHKLVIRAEAQGRVPVIIGTPTHPEVQAIAGWCAHPHVFEGPEALENWLREDPSRAHLRLTLVSQTTSTQNLWESCKKIIKKQCTNSEIFDTICEATENRQKEAGELARCCDAMVIVGDPMSSNTKRLAMICRQFCEDVWLVEDAGGLDVSHFSCIGSVGITAGASTPAWIIKEVNNIMSEEIKVETAQEENFAELLEQSIKTLNNGDKVTGIVTAIGATEIQVDLGTKHAGYIPVDDFSSDPSVKPEDVLKVGDEIEVLVVHVNDSEGTARLSKKRLEAGKAWEEIEAAAESKAVVEGLITEENKGGIVANVKGIRVFIPASQTGVPKGGDLSALVKTTVQMKITEVNRARRRVVGSIRAVTNELRKAAQEKIWAEIEVGKKYHGVVKSLTSYGAFVDIGGVDGMVHVSELSWNRIKNPAEVVKVGDEIEVFVISYDPEKKKISLGYKTPETNPWNIFMTQFHVGDVAKVKIVKLMTFGAFAEIIPGVDGLIHISQIADRRIGKPEDVLSEGMEVDAKIIDIDAENKRISLSIRALLTASDDEAVEE
ncbi:MAG TPA: bifunctional 4-hydroxy-3-methylbut-2-enyl diphosphate reductase/30S ribosomal protein S1 [Candidatus Avoscillospira stercorigallinarum]|uniref:4-hydroxy-3-methylbut-2-enyl diphosphate reductase n=1 Tax=Candidatus Avoscillospira stercorigallinarum TaxID=2840708 RepID=A0A9D0Z7E2_9FIRM|nr:bifunctional 4-hydroxy-3-methylbut-2-enyl diphosphate reductase/30S ribosomal protein S1 [Candidatus Avoscillospira stercorigallinarum]